MADTQNTINIGTGAGEETHYSVLTHWPSESDFVILSLSNTDPAQSSISPSLSHVPTAYTASDSRGKYYYFPQYFVRINDFQQKTIDINIFFPQSIIPSLYLLPFITSPTTLFERYFTNNNSLHISGMSLAATLICEICLEFETLTLGPGQFDVIDGQW